MNISTYIWERGIHVIALIIPVIIGLVFCIAYFFETGSKSHLFSGCVLFLVVIAAIFAALIMFIGS